MDNFLKNSLITFLTEIIIFIFGFVTTIIIARTLGPEGRGLYSLLLIIPGLMLNFGGMGIGTANVYFTGNKKYKVGDVVSNSLLLAVSFGFILIILFGLLSQTDSFRQFIKVDKIPSLCLWLILLSIPFSFVFSFFQSIIRGTGDLKNYNKARILESLFVFLAVPILLLILKQGLFGAIISYVASVIAATIFVFITVKKISRFYFYLNKKLLKESIIYGGKAYLANAVSFLNYRLDMVLIAVLIGSGAAASVGFYSIAVSMAEKIFIIPVALATVLFPAVSSFKANEANDLTPKVVRQTLFMVLLLSIALFFLAEPLVSIVFGREFLPSVKPLIILLPGIIAFSVGGVIAADLSGRGKPQFAIYSSLACLVVNIILNILLIPKMGISGAALASTVAYWVDTIIVLFAFVRISKRRLFEVLFIRAEDFKDYYKLSLFLWKKIN